MFETITIQGKDMTMLMEMNEKRTNRGAKERIKAFSEIKLLNENITALFRNSGLITRPGTLLKIYSGYYPNYGFEATKENKNELLEIINKFYNKDRENESQEKTINPRGLIIQPYFHFTNSTVNHIARAVLLKMKEMKPKADELIKICIIGSRDGTLILAILNAIREMRASFLDRTQFYLVEPYQKKLEATMAKLPIYGLRSISETKAGGFSAEYKTDDEFLATQKSSEFDIVISYYHLHCKPFQDNLSEIRRVLKDDGVFMMADYFSPLFGYPAFVVDLLMNIGADNDIIRKFAASFDCFTKPNLSELEENALNDHIEYWVKIVNELRNARIQLEKPIYFLRAHTTLEKRIEILKEHKFTIDTRKIQKIIKRFKEFKRPNPYRLDPTTDFISLILAVKEE